MDLTVTDGATRPHTGKAYAFPKATGTPGSRNLFSPGAGGRTSEIKGLRSIVSLQNSCAAVLSPSTSHGDRAAQG